MVRRIDPGDAAHYLFLKPSRPCENSGVFLIDPIFVGFWSILSDQKPANRKNWALSEPVFGRNASFHTVCKGFDPTLGGGPPGCTAGRFCY